MDLSRYFDNAATTPVDPSARDAMLPFLGEACGNAHSVHAFGAEAREAVDHAREQVAVLVGAEDPSEIVFTSGATESNNWVLRSFRHVAVGPMEHSSVFETARRLGQHVLGWREWVEPPMSRVELASLMRVNNETGQIFDPASLAPSCAYLHSDLTQAVGKIEVNLGATPIVLASFSAHKIYGPKGVGALYVRGGTSIQPLVAGGEQEYGMRAGTLNVPGIAGFGEACRIALDRHEQDAVNAASLKEEVLGALVGVSDLRVNGGDSVSPFILSASFLGVEGETLVLELDRLGFAVSAGAACSSGSTEPSHVLLALGLEPEWLRGTIRISFGRTNTLEAASQLGRALKQAVGTIREMKV